MLFDQCVGCVGGFCGWCKVYTWCVCACVGVCVRMRVYVCVCNMCGVWCVCVCECGVCLHRFLVLQLNHQLSQKQFTSIQSFTLLRTELGDIPRSEVPRGR